ncbi:MAG: hypothetical protein AAF586_03620 [Planctomycetota bacterium]
MTEGVLLAWLAQAEAPLRRGPMIDVAEVSKYFAEDRESLINPWAGLIAIGSAVVVVSALAGWRWWHRREERSRPGWLLREVRGALGLSRGDARLLRRLAAASDLPHPLTLVVSRSAYEHHVAGYLADSRDDAERLRPRFKSLGQQVFSDPKPTP